MPSSPRIQALDAVLSDGTDIEELKAARGDCAVYRVPGADGSAVLKVWNRRGIKGALRRLTRTAPCYREAAALLRLDGADIRVPRLLDFGKLPRASGWTEALLLEDLGPCVPALEQLKCLRREGRHTDLEALLDQVHRLTCAMVERGVLDTDHSFVNIVVTADGFPARIDFEIAQVWRFPSLAVEAYGQMIGRLLATLAFALQPDTSPVPPFGERLLKRLDPPHAVRREAQRHFEAILAYQRAQAGIDTRVAMSWA